MNILYLTYDVINEEPIVITQVVEMCNRISKQNDNVFFNIVSFKRTKNDEVNYRTYLPNIEFHYIKKTDIFLLDYINFLILSTLVCLKKKTEIIHVRSYIPMPIAIFLKLFLRKIVLFDMRGLLPEEHIYFNGKSKQSFFYIFMKFFEFIFVKLSNHIVVVSHNFKDYLISRYKNICEISVIYCSANQCVNDLEIDNSRNKFYSKYQIDENQILITYVGSFYKYQNIDKLLNFIRVSSEYQSIKFLLFTKTEKSTVYDMLNKSGLNLNNVIVDYIESNELGKYLRFCDYGIILRDSDIINKVSSPIKISEYISNNLPILFSGDIGDFNTLIKKFGCGYDFGSLDNDKLNLLKSNNKIIDERLRKLVGYDFNQEQYFLIYKNLIDKTGAY